jgi:hypothetical protein
MLVLGFLAGGLALVGTLKLLDLQLGPNPLGLVHFIPALTVMVFNKLFDLRAYLVLTMLAGAVVVVEVVKVVGKAIDPM